MPQFLPSPKITFLCALLALATATYAQTEAFLTMPDIHGDKIVFTAEGDLWLGDIETGNAWRITSDPGVESNAHFSPDGSEIAFSAGYDGGKDVYLMPTAGGQPRRLTYDTSWQELPGAITLGWTPDGQGILFATSAKLYANRFEQEMTQQLFVVPKRGGLPKLLPVPRGSYAAFKSDGQTLAYVPTSSGWMNWFRYQGGNADQIWLTNTKTGKFQQLTDSKWVDTQPLWIGSTIYFVSERSGTRNLYKLDPDSKKVTQLTFSKDLPVRFPSTDGHRIVFQLGPKLAVYDPKSGLTHTLQIKLHSDRIHARPFEFPIAGTKPSAISPDGKRIALAPRGHLVTVSAETEGAPMHILVSDSAQRAQNPAWSPDGKKIAYLSDASGEEQLYLVSDDGHEAPRQLTRHLTGQHGSLIWSPDSRHILLGNRTGDVQLIDTITGEPKTIAHNQGENGANGVQNDFAFSPDSRWVAYSISTGWRYNTVFLYEIATTKTTEVSHPDIDSSSPIFSPDGKYLFFLQDRSLSQKWNGLTGRSAHLYATQITGVALSPTTLPPGSLNPTNKATNVDVTAIQTRPFDLKVAPGQYSGLLAIPGHLLIQSGSTILSCDIATGKTTTLAQDGEMEDLTPDGKKLLIASGNTPKVIGTDGSAAATEVKLEGLTVTVDPEKEWRQIYEEGWRIARDFFYDPNMLGVDWNAIHTKYKAQLPFVACRYDLRLLLSDMISELNTSHCFTGALPEFVGKTLRPATLGADLAWDSAANAYKITHILKGNAWSPDTRSPLAEPGLDIQEGDCLLAINQTQLTSNQDPTALLLGAAGHPTELLIRQRRNAQERKITVLPLQDEIELRMTDWIESRRAYVEKASNGQIAYVCLSNMSDTGANQLAEEYYPNVNKPGILLDVRGNDGGNISGNVLGDIGSRRTGFFAYRAGGNYRREGWAPLGQVALLTNEWAFSDADYFSEFFKRLKIGPLIGHRTTGGVVGPAIYHFVDGSGIGIPNYGAWVDGEWIVEGRGAIPDYEVDQDPAAVLAGKDPQLEKAVEVLLQRIKEHPLKLPQHPPYPVKLGGSNNH